MSILGCGFNLYIILDHILYSAKANSYGNSLLKKYVKVWILSVTISETHMTNQTAKKKKKMLAKGLEEIFISHVFPFTYQQKHFRDNPQLYLNILDI